MMIAVRTTHNTHLQHWLLLFNHVSSAKQNASNIMDAFNRLKKGDKDSVLTCERMKTFITGSLKLAELGVWVCASCVEAVVHEAVSVRVLTQCQLFVKAASSIWDMKDKVLACTVVNFSVLFIIVLCMKSLLPLFLPVLCSKLIMNPY